MPDFLTNLTKDILKKISSGILFGAGIVIVTFTVVAFQAPTGGDTNPTTAGYTSASSWISTSLTSMISTLTAIKAKTDGITDPTTTLTAIKSKTDTITDPTGTLALIKAKTDTISPDSGWHGCYRKTCEIHNAASCVVAACDAGETDKGSSCPRNGGLWNAQDNYKYIYDNRGGSYNYSIYGSYFNADYYVTCERWCCQ